MSLQNIKQIWETYKTDFINTQKDAIDIDRLTTFYLALQKLSILITDKNFAQQQLEQMTRNFHLGLWGEILEITPEQIMDASFSLSVEEIVEFAQLHREVVLYRPEKVGKCNVRAMINVCIVEDMEEIGKKAVTQGEENLTFFEKDIWRMMKIRYYERLERDVEQELSDEQKQAWKDQKMREYFEAFGNLVPNQKLVEHIKQNPKLIRSSMVKLLRPCESFDEAGSLFNTENDDFLPNQALVPIWKLNKIIEGKMIRDFNSPAIGASLSGMLSKIIASGDEEIITKAKEDIVDVSWSVMIFSEKRSVESTNRYLFGGADCPYRVTRSTMDTFSANLRQNTAEILHDDGQIFQVNKFKEEINLDVSPEEQETAEQVAKAEYCKDFYHREREANLQVLTKAPEIVSRHSDDWFFKNYRMKLEMKKIYEEELRKVVPYETRLADAQSARIGVEEAQMQFQ
ncbi:MAG: hypothetical protein LBB39_00515 [Mycoplasmataceae bacterium]|nr:hypothetical protein [Mycoplasmataceae bacterium]